MIFPARRILEVGFFRFCASRLCQKAHQDAQEAHQDAQQASEAHQDAQDAQEA